jgi:hypothetical protein
MKLNQLRQIIREELKGGPSSDRMYNQILARGVEGGSTQPKTWFDNKANIKDMANRIIRHVTNISNSSLSVDSKKELLSTIDKAERDLRMLRGMVEKL